MIRIEKIIFKNERGQKIELKNHKPFILTSVKGTESPDINILSSKSPGQDGASYQGTILNERIVVLEGGIVGFSKEDMFNKRQQLVSIFSPKLKGNLTYINDSVSYDINCIVEQGPVWAEKVNNIQKFMIQLYCPNPYWLDKLIKEEIALWVGDFEFPLEIDSVEGIEMGHRVSNLIVNIFNKGDVPCGMKIEFKALATVENPSLFNINTREYIKINQNLIAGDTLTIETTFANKRIELNRNGVVTNAFHYIDLDSEFLQVDVGDNLFRYDAEQGIDNLEVSIYYKPQFLGV